MTEHEVRVEDLTHDGSGVVKFDNRVYFVQGVLPGELIRFKPGRKRRGKFDGILTQILEPAGDRVEPDCQYFENCGGCVMQHLLPSAQLAYKEKILFDNLKRIGKVSVKNSLPPIQDNIWHYRRKARLGVKLVPKKGGVLVGFREPRSSFITSLMDCKTLDKRISALLPGLHDLIGRLCNNHRIPQIEVAAGDNQVALVIRHLEALTQQDLCVLRIYAQNAAVTIYSQSGGPNTIKPIWPDIPPQLHYKLNDFDIVLEFEPTDFIQVNAAVNQALIRRVVSILDPQKSDYVLDLFCGLGNFTLALAKSDATVVGIDGEDDLVRRGMRNAKLNHIDNVAFHKQDLFNDTFALNKKDFDAVSFPNSGARFNKILIDPPRSGARAVVTNLIPKLQPERVVYVSCNPATLARDADVMVNINGYRLTQAGVIDMFPHTAHIESMAVFDRSHQ